MPAPKLEGHAHAEAFHTLPERLTLVDDPRSPFYDERIKKPVPEWLIQSVMEMGVIKPVVVMRDGPRLVIDDGRQRVRALIEANRRLIAAGKEPLHVVYIIRKPKDGDAGIVGLARAANLHVEDSPMERARAAARLVDVAVRDGMSESEARLFAASRCGVKSGQAVANWTALLGLATPLQKAVDTGELSEARARELLVLPRDQQTAAYEAMRAAGATKGTAARRAVRDAKAGRPVAKRETTRARNRSLVEAVVAKLTERRDAEDIGLSATAEAFLNGLRWNAGEEVVPPDDVLEVLAEIEAAKREKAA